LLTLYTTPVIYLYFDRLRLWLARRRDFEGQCDVPLEKGNSQAPA
jgi:multidrug efflux pump